MPLKILWNCIYNSIIGAIVLYIINFLGFVYIPINFITALIAGIFGVPGVLVLAIYSML
ncbi:pro-sigmaK processing inhibitor BofA family protein [Megamonas hypermegale]|nr:pro-sigmaK processing inhibitor BofA family protein [Megamonas hypermegale]